MHAPQNLRLRKAFPGRIPIEEDAFMHITYRAFQSGSQDRSPLLTEVMPFGRYGGGLLTAHPIGLVIVIGLLIVGFIGMPEARWFLTLAVPLGGICGLFLWLHHRKSSQF